MEWTAQTTFSGRKRNMSSPIIPTEGPSGPAITLTSLPGGRDDVVAFVAALAGEGALAIDASRGAPPPEVLDQIAAAAGVYEHLRENGMQISFVSGGEDGRTRIELRDDAGRVRELSVAEAAELATRPPVREG